MWCFVQNCSVYYNVWHRKPSNPQHTSTHLAFFLTLKKCIEIYNVNKAGLDILKLEGLHSVRRACGVLWMCVLYVHALFTRGFAGKVTLVTTSGVSSLSSSLPRPLHSEIHFIKINRPQQAHFCFFSPSSAV